MMFRPVLPLYILIVALVLIVVATVFCIIVRNHRKSSNFIRLGILFLILAALFRPVLPLNGQVSAAHSNTVLFFIVDSTGSMAVEDVEGKMRIEKVRSDMKKIINSFDAPKVSVYAQDITTYRMMPVSSDVTAALNLASNISVRNSSASEGTNLNLLLNSAADYINAYHERDKEAEIVVFFMSDGDNNATNKHDNTHINDDDFNSISYGAVIGYGTKEGGKVPKVIYSTTEFGIYEYEIKPDDRDGGYITFKGKPVFSSLNEDYLRNAADSYKFDYGQSGNVDSMIEKAKKNTGKNIIIGDNVENNMVFETYWIFMLAAGVLMLVEFFKDFNSFLSEREAKK